jgi:hypothetical protein
MPSYPEAAREVRIANLRCEATIGFGADGVPYAIDVMACPAAFHTNTLDALQQWRWDDGPARTTVGVTFKRAE